MKDALHVRVTKDSVRPGRLLANSGLHNFVSHIVIECEVDSPAEHDEIVKRLKEHPINLQESLTEVGVELVTRGLKEEIERLKKELGESERMRIFANNELSRLRGL
jgi:hypothetical protein